MLRARLARRQRALGLPDLTAYARHLERRDGGAERAAFVGAVTTHVSAFFREPRQFERLRNELLPGLVSRARAGEPVRLWSAGCAGGQEALTLAMLILAAMPDAAAFDIQILATDVDPAMTEQARRLSIAPADAAAIPDRLRRMFVGPEDGGRMRLSARLAPLVRVATHNLHDPWPWPTPFDAICCRNVLIYFPPSRQDRLCARFVEALRPGGWLCLGHAERPGPTAEAALAPLGDRVWQKGTGSETARHLPRSPSAAALIRPADRGECL